MIKPQNKMENYRAEETNCETSLKTNRIKRKKKKKQKKHG